MQRSSSSVTVSGIVARQYLLHVKDRYGHTALGRFRLAITLGTPMQGSSLTRLAVLASSNEQLRVLGPIRTNDYLQLLNHTVWDFFAKHEVGCPSLKVFAAYEELGVTGVGIVVDQESATLDASEVKGFNRDHISLPKPAGTSDEVYAWAKRSMVDCPRWARRLPGCGPDQVPGAGLRFSRAIDAARFLGMSAGCTSDAGARCSPSPTTTVSFRTHKVIH